MHTSPTTTRRESPLPSSPFSSPPLPSTPTIGAGDPSSGVGLPRSSGTDDGHESSLLLKPRLCHRSQPGSLVGGMSHLPSRTQVPELPPIPSSPRKTSPVRLFVPSSSRPTDRVPILHVHEFCRNDLPSSLPTHTSTCQPTHLYPFPPSFRLNNLQFWCHSFPTPVSTLPGTPSPRPSTLLKVFPKPPVTSSPPTYFLFVTEKRINESRRVFYVRNHRGFFLFSTQRPSTSGRPSSRHTTSPPWGLVLGHLDPKDRYPESRSVN